MNQNQLKRHKATAASSPKPAAPESAPTGQQVPNCAPSSSNQELQLRNLRLKASSSAGSPAVAANQEAPEQSAFDLAHSAASMAAAKFKMLRSNTLAAAFGRPQVELPPTGSGNQNQSWDLLTSMRPKDERIVNTLSPAANKIH